MRGAGCAREAGRQGREGGWREVEPSEGKGGVFVLVGGVGEGSGVREMMGR